MPAAYDKYDYPKYWKGRSYEHQSEIIAINKMLSKIPKVDNAVEIGAGYGRLTPSYFHKAKKLLLTDPSSRLLKIARNKYKDKNIMFLQSKLETLPKKLSRKKFDLVIMVRVLHHIESLDTALQHISTIISNKGHLILEFPNKMHLKARLNEFFHGNFTFPIDIFPKDLTRNKNKPCLPFINYHPEIVTQKLQDSGFLIIDHRSVSNIRLPFAKKFLPLSLLMKLEVILQKPFSKFYLGPSIFILAKKVS